MSHSPFPTSFPTAPNPPGAMVERLNHLGLLPDADQPSMT
ncbi:hypothetical protein ACVIGB_008819 [Bradyrhizobium sp. USDA 4341]